MGALWMQHRLKKNSARMGIAKRRLCPPTEACVRLCRGGGPGSIAIHSDFDSSWAVASSIRVIKRHRTPSAASQSRKSIKSSQDSEVASNRGHGQFWTIADDSAGRPPAYSVRGTILKRRFWADPSSFRSNSSAQISV